MIKIYNVFENTDPIGGRGAIVYRGTYLHRDIAEAVVRTMTYDDMGIRPCGEIRESYMAENYDEVEVLKKKKLIDSAKAKLTPEEIKALGIR